MEQNNGLVNLSKGGRVDLQKVAPALKRVRIGLGWKANGTDTGAAFDLDVTAFVLNKNAAGELVCTKPEHMVFYNNLATPGKEVTHTGDNRTGDATGDDESIIVDVEKLLAFADEVSFVITIDEAAARKQNFGQVSQSYAKIYNDEDGKILAQYDLEEGFSSETAVQVGSLYKNNDGHMAFKAVGAGFKTGLADFVKQYGLGTK